jgi:hypothetical protein
MQFNTPYEAINDKLGYIVSDIARRYKKEFDQLDLTETNAIETLKGKLCIES